VEHATVDQEVGGSSPPSCTTWKLSGPDKVTDRTGHMGDNLVPDSGRPALIWVLAECVRSLYAKGHAFGRRPTWTLG